MAATVTLDRKVKPRMPPARSSKGGPDSIIRHYLNPMEEARRGHPACMKI
jgi:hypothetical protein